MSNFSKKFDFILSTEHGPKGGDEININIKLTLFSKKKKPELLSKTRYLAN